ncbi:MAG: MlaD family protein [Marinifilaceae bacterium]|jgi:phospholipid/cholesterol/gamma-HCH transport system substrate-binding protein|nr:MlaD family protein [Marinifilaceae bacterium]
MKIKKSRTIGILVILTILMLIWGINFLKGHNIFYSHNYFYVKYNNISGLKTSDPVNINGYKIGQVSDINLKNLSSNFIIKIDISADYKIPVGSKLNLTDSDLMGSKEIQILSSKSNQYHSVGDTIDGKITGGMIKQFTSQIEPIQKKAENMLSNLDSSLIAVNKILNAETVANLNSIIKHMNNTAASMDRIVGQKSNELKQIVDNSADISNQLNQNMNNINDIIRNIKMITDSLSNAGISKMAKRTDSLLTASNKIFDKINNGENNINSLLTDNKLYTNLENATNNLNNILLDFQNNPKRYFHMSLIDKGKIYIKDYNSVYTDAEFAVCIKQSKNKLDISKDFPNEKDIKESYQNGIYYYTKYSEKNIEKLSKAYRKLKDKYPDAEIINLKTYEKVYE